MTVTGASTLNGIFNDMGLYITLFVISFQVRSNQLISAKVLELADKATMDIIQNLYVKVIFPPL